ncbi:AfsA-related hotdog domain-containing protein [Streptomyces sp. NPDC087859]|uniref:AfsA-related hotdog domain-containing protein n=1 Tax=Streptomyces sp. NPDC087859 TaxID=3365812 RepID=UPI00380BACB6
MSQHAVLGALDTTAVARRLVHSEHPHSAPAGEQRFVLRDDMPLGHPLFNDTPGLHDPLVFVELVRRAGLHVGHRHFGVPVERPALFYRFALRLSDPAVWQDSAEGARLALEMRAEPTRTVAGVPRSLRLGGTLRLEGAEACTGSAELVFVTPTVARNHRATSRLGALVRTPAADGPRPGTRPAAPSLVGRCTPDNVVVSEPVRQASTLTTTVLVDPSHPVFFTEATDSVPGLLLVEALRQSALLAVASDGAAPCATALTWLSVHLRGHAELDLPLTCTARSAPGGIDALGRRLTRVLLTLRQAGRTTAQAEAVTAEAG